MNKENRLRSFFSGALIGGPLLLGSLTLATVAPSIAPGLEYVFGTNSTSPKLYSIIAIATSVMVSFIPLLLMSPVKKNVATYILGLVAVTIPAVGYLGTGTELAQKAVGIDLI